MHFRGFCLTHLIPRFSELDIGNFTALTSLIIGVNPFTGTLPTEVGLMSSLSYDLGLSYCHFHGTLPTEMGQLSGLNAISSSLSFKYNLLSGQLPTELFKLTGL